MPELPIQQRTRMHLSAWHDAVLVLVVAILSVLLSAHFELTEAFYSMTRRWEFVQLDELSVGMLVLAIGLTWLSWRRYRQAQSELQARELAEARLAEVLTQNRKLAQEQLRIQELERKHLARELHDQLGQYLNAIKLDAVSICESDAGDRQSASSAAHSIIRSVDHVHGAVSDMIVRLRPVGLDELGLVAAIEHCLDHWRQRLPCTRFSLAVSGDVEALSEALTLTLYRLIQEGLTNIYKHASAQHAQVALERRLAGAGDIDELHLMVSDDGRGMQADAPTSRFGLSGMRERVEIVGGTFVLKSAPGRGLSFEACLPATLEG